MSLGESLRRSAYRQLNSPPFLGAKYSLRHHLSTLQSIGGDLRQALSPGNGKYYKRYERSIPLGVLFFGVTNICNARCLFCAYKDSKGPRGVMGFSTFRKAADDYAAMGGRAISFTPTVGEPLLDPGLLRKVRYAVSLPGIENVLFYTNGILLANKESYRKLVDSGIHEIRISMAETMKDSYTKVYGVDAYDMLMAGLQKLLSYNKERGEPVLISLNFRSSSSPDDVIRSPDFKRVIAPYLSGRVMYDFINDYDNWGGTIRQQDLLGVMRLRRIPRLKRVPCVKTFDLMVLYNGAVRLCACRIKGSEFDELIVGDLTKQGLRDIFYGPKAASLRERFVRGNLPPVCRDCSLYAPASGRWIKRRAGGAGLFYHPPFALEEKGASP